MPAKRVADLPAVEIPGEHARSLRTVFSPEQDPELVGDLTFFICDIYAGSSSDRHTHDSSGEIMYILSGRAQGFLGDESFPLEANTCFYAPPNVPHQIKNTGNETLRLVALFAPAVGTAYARAKAAETKA